MVREKIDPLEDGADEQMLGVEENEKLTVKDEVKFISGDHQKNGDAKIDIIAGKKEEPVSLYFNYFFLNQKFNYFKFYLSEFYWNDKRRINEIC